MNRNFCESAHESCQFFFHNDINSSVLQKCKPCKLHLKHLVFSRCFSWKEPTIVMAFRQCFFFLKNRYTWSDQNSSAKRSTKFHLLAQGTEPKKFFPRNIHYRARLKCPHFQFFGIVQVFSGKKFTKGPPSIFFGILRQNDCYKIPKGPPFSFLAL